MTVSEVAKILDAGKRAGCTEALFTFEEMPEEHSEFREWIEDIRYSSVIDYLIDLCKIAIDCGMLPHSNPDVLESRDIRRALAAQCKHGADGRVYAFTEIVTGDPNHGGAVNVVDVVIALQMAVRGEWLEIRARVVSIRSG